MIFISTFASGIYAQNSQMQEKQTSHDRFAQSDRYKDLKEIYDWRQYTYSPIDRRNPGWCGFASFVIPGLGQAINNEWGRAIGFFLGSTIAGTSMNNFIRDSYIDYYPYWKYDVYKAVAFGAITLGLDIWSIIDAVRITKVKNMHYRSLFSDNIELSVTPSLMGVPIWGGSITNVLGVSFSITM